MTGTDSLALRVLLVEDEPFVRATLKRMLLLVGCSEIREAADGSEALRLLDDNDFRPELIICDVQMEPMDGLTFVRELRSTQHQGQARVPVIMLTALSDGVRIPPPGSLEVASYLSKPVYTQQLAASISIIFGRPVAVRHRHTSAGQ